MKKRFFTLAMVTGVMIGGASLGVAAVIGTNVPAERLTPERLTALPTAQREVWAAYLARSEAQKAADKFALEAERKGIAVPPAPVSGNGEKTMPLDRPTEWYGTVEARNIADTIVSFQTPAGGWGKNQPRDAAPRLKGQAYVAGNLSKYSQAGDFDIPLDPDWNYVGTIDNGATVTEVQFLARVANAAPGAEGDAYREAAIRGVTYLLAAQFPNGGWPQVWPLQGGYHDALTLNDNALISVVEVLSLVADGEGDYGFMPTGLRIEAAAAEKRAVECVLKLQMARDGQKTLWGQQYDALTLMPVSARNYEPGALSTGESAGILLYLMSLTDPSPEVVAAIESGVATLKALTINDMAWTKTEADGRKLIPQAGAGPLWARFYEPQSLKPIFGDRDKSLHDEVNALSLERRNGYAWYNTAPKKALDTYVKWKSKRP